MIGSQIGPYRVESELGAGGMGTVYLAEVTEQTPVLDEGQRIALKIVHPHLLATPGFFKRFLQEAEVGKKIRHENVVRTFEVDATLHEDKQVNYMAMEYVEGRSLRQLLLDLHTVPEALLREIAIQTAAGLQAIHSGGIVHRDLKPENVLITDDQRVRIMDLGVAKLQDASIALTREGQFTGSLLYAAPEQCQGREVGGAADLYALGVMLYELATGQNPFRRDDAVAVIKAHMTLDPPRAHERNPDISPLLSEVCAALMAKDPKARFPSAQALRDVLVQGEKSEWWAEREKMLRTVVAELPSIQVRRETTLHGRTEELDVLARAWEEAKQGEGNVLLVEGEAGLGKTRLIDAFLRSVKTEDAHVLYGSYPPSGGLGGMSDAIIGKFGSSGLTDNLAPYMGVTPTLIPAFAALVRHESPPTGSEPLQGDALSAVICHVMRALAEEKPTIWVIEDLHFAPGDSRHVVLSMARALRPHRVLLIASARNLPEGDLTHLSRLEHYRGLRLSRLGARDVIALLRDAFQSEVLADKLGAKIAYKSDGVPFFVIEMFRALKSGKYLTAQPDGTYVQSQQITDIEVPSAVKDLIESRLRSLEKPERAILEVGAVQGNEFDPDLVARVLEKKKVSVLQDLAEIERRSGIVQGKAGVCRFDQYQIQEVLYKDLMPDLRTEYHALLAEAFQEREDFEPEETETEEAFFMARHHLLGSRPKASLPYLTRALDYLEGAYQNDAAIELAQRALGVKRLLKGKDRVDTLIRLAGRLDELGRRKEQRAAVDAAVEFAEGAAQQVRARVAKARYFDQTSQFAEVLACAEEAVAIADATPDKALQAAALQPLGGAFYRLGRGEDALDAFDRSVSLFRDVGQTTGEMVATGRLGVTYWSLGLYTERLDCHVRRMEFAKGEGGRNESVACHNLANVLSDLGRLDEAVELQERALLLGREAGIRTIEAYASYELGRIAERQGDRETAGRRYRVPRAFAASWAIAKEPPRC